jgi:hypothetical protein
LTREGIRGQGEYAVDWRGRDAEQKMILSKGGTDYLGRETPGLGAVFKGVLQSQQPADDVYFKAAEGRRISPVSRAEKTKVTEIWNRFRVPPLHAPGRLW